MATLEQKIAEMLKKQSSLTEGTLGTDEALAASAGIQKTGLPVGTPEPGDQTPPMQGGSQMVPVDKLDDDAPGEDASLKQGTGVAAQTILTKGVATDAVVPSMAEAVAEIFKGQDLTEEVKSKATELFEAAVTARANHKVSEIEKTLKEEQEKSLEVIQSKLEEQIDAYMTYAVEDWAKQNAVGINQGLRTEITESFMNGLKGLFQESMLNVPEDSVNVIDSLVEANDLIKAEVNEVTSKLLEARKEAEVKEKALLEQIQTLEKNQILESAAKGLTAVDAEKLKTLVEGVEFSSKELFEEKVSLIKKTHFGQAKGSSSSLLKEESKQSEQKADSAIDAYVQALKHISR